MINYDTKECETVYSPIFKKAYGFCKTINAYDDVWYWYVAEEVAKKIINKNLIIDDKCIANIFEWKDLGMSDYDYILWSGFKKHIEKGGRL